MVEKYREKRKELYVAFMDMEKTYDKACREELWRMLHEYRVDGYLIRSMISSYDRSTAYVRLGRRVGKYFEARRGLRQGYNVRVSFDRMVECARKN